MKNKTTELSCEQYDRRNGIEHDTNLMMEMCVCGHLRKDHADGVHDGFSKELCNLFAFGHGRCMYGLGVSCKCKRYTFKSDFNPKKIVRDKNV